MSGVFVSHASADREFVDRFVEQILRLGCGLPPEFVFYSSGADTGVPSGSDLGGYVRDRLKDVSLVIAIVTPTFQTRPYCVAELGAAWGRVGKLFPLLAPGTNRDDLDGVLRGMLIRYADEPSALDELHDAVANVTDMKVRVATWGAAKERWLANVNELASRMPSAETVSIAEHKALRAQLADARAGLAQSEEDLRGAQDVIQRLTQAKTAGQVREALVPEDEVSQFQLLLDAFWDVADKVNAVVIDAVWYELTHNTLSWPHRIDEEDWHDSTKAAVEDGYLVENYANDLSVDLEFPAVKRVYDAAKRLDEFLKGAGPNFVEWFVLEYDLPPDITKKKVWSTLSHRPYGGFDL